MDTQPQPRLQGDVFSQLEDGDAGPQLWEVSPAKVPPLGRVLSNLLCAESKDLQKALAQRSGKAQHGPLAKALSALLRHVKLLVQNGNPLDPVAVPLLEQVVKSKDHISRKPGFCLLCSLLENEEVGWAVTTQLSGLIRKDGTDNRVRLGWCLVVRELIQSGSIRCNSERSLDESGFDLDMVSVFATCIPQLVHIVCHASVRDGKRRVPTRLTTAAADCTLIITKALAKGPETLKDLPERIQAPNKSERPIITVIESNASNCAVEPLGDDEQPSCSGRQERRERLLWDQLDNLVMLVAELLEWNAVSRPLHTVGLQQVHKRLQALANFRDSLQVHDGGGSDLKTGMSVLTACWQQYSSFMIFEDQALSSHPQKVLQESMGALQYCSQEDMTGYQNEGAMSEGHRRADEMRRFALACLSLILGRLGQRQLDLAMAEIEPQLLKLILYQLRCGDVQAVDLSVAILRALLFRSVLSESATDSASSSFSRLEGLIPSLMELLDERDSAARAVVLLVSEFFAANPGSPEFELLFKRLDSPESLQRRNALDVLGQLLSITTRTADVADSILSQTLAEHLLSRLGDEELTNRVEASALFAKLDPRFFLPALVNSVFSVDGRVRSSASSAILSVLKSHSNDSHVVCILLDCITKLLESSSPTVPGQAEASEHTAGANSPKPRVDMDRIMNLVPDWAITVQEWEPLTRLLLNKMVAEPSNPVLPRFLSQISPFVIDKAHVIFSHVFDVISQQRMLGSDVLTRAGEAKSWEADGGAIARELFQRLNPLLVLKVLPLEMFNDKEDKHLYGDLLHLISSGSDNMNSSQLIHKELPAHDSCVASLLLWRMRTTYEFREVRKLAAEITGRLVPEILLPQMSIQLEDATRARDLLGIKACIYALCNAFMLRGKSLLFYRDVSTICSLLTSVLLWPPSNEALVQAQHGCIDCFAVMVLAELSPAEQASVASSPTASIEANEMATPVVEGSPNRKLDDEIGTGPETDVQLSRIFKVVDDFSDRPKLIEEVTEKSELPEVIRETMTIEEIQNKRSSSDNPAGLTRICDPVLRCLTGQLKHVPFTLPEHQCANSTGNLVHPTQMRIDGPQGKLVFEEPLLAPIPFRLCMANALISACQKVPVNSRMTFAQVVVPPVMHYVKDGTEAPIIAACLQVLFSAVYHLKAPAVLPYCTDLLSLAITLIRGSSPCEVRVGSVKVFTALLASEEAVLKELAPRLMEAQSVLASVARMDTSLEMRNLCEQLLGCIATPAVSFV